nr:NADH dehydrogenase subunit 5, mitochondrial [Tanacetum cinerariifolium]
LFEHTVPPGDQVDEPCDGKPSRTVQRISRNMRLNAITLICILLLIGAAGKSAQIGSHTWSPDAMKGPTLVYALIHAATMVTAGVFMIARCSPLFEYPPIALIVITFAGAMTSFLVATTGILQNDLKRVIAYSTCSQLGYMIFACGISNYLPISKYCDEAAVAHPTRLYEVTIHPTRSSGVNKNWGSDAGEIHNNG